MGYRFKLRVTLGEALTALELMQAMVTVWAGVLLLNPAAKAASLAMLEVFTSWMTLPYTM